MGWSADVVRSWRLDCADRMDAAAPELNELDRRLGDGDLGVAVEKCTQQMRTAFNGNFAAT